jgi:glycerophosphoryl diester phosphodiesterase
MSRTLGGDELIGKKIRWKRCGHLFFGWPVAENDHDADIAEGVAVWQSRSVTVIIAHRGASAAEPENTLAAFARAAQLGADAVELDVRATADRRLVVHHDPRTGDGAVIVESVAADLPRSIPDLAAALDACDGMFVNIEIKNDPEEPDFDPSDWTARAVCGLLARRGQLRRWLISSFRYETIAVCHAVLPGVRTAWLVGGADPATVERAAAGGHDAIHPWVVGLTEDQVRRAHIAGLAVNTWTCDDPDRMRELIAWGIDGICTNVPDVALAVRRQDTGSVG